MARLMRHCYVAAIFRRRPRPGPREIIVHVVPPLTDAEIKFAAKSIGIIALVLFLIGLTFLCSIFTVGFDGAHRRKRRKATALHWSPRRRSCAGPGPFLPSILGPGAVDAP